MTAGPCRRRTLTLAIALVLGAAWPGAGDGARAADLSGRATVIDGDTIEIDGQTIHLHGIDAPESGQICDLQGKAWHCGHAATALLVELIGQEWVVCHGRGTRHDGDRVAKCKVDWLDLGAEMVTRGMAIAYLSQSRDYLPNYREARGKGNGIFAGVFIEPEKWRHGARLAIESAAPDTPAPE